MITMGTLGDGYIFQNAIVYLYEISLKLVQCLGWVRRESLTERQIE